MRQVPLVPHLRRLNAQAGCFGFCLDVLRPVFAPLRRYRCLVVHTVKHVAEPQRIRKYFVNKSPLIFEHGFLVAFSRHRPEKIVIRTGRMTVDPFRQPCLFSGVVDIILRVERIDRPVVAIIIESRPDFYLNNNIPLICQFKELLEPPPVFSVPLVQVVFAVYFFEWPDIAFVSAGHSVAHVVTAHGLEQVQVLFQIRNLKKIVVLSTTYQQNGLTLILPVCRIWFINLYPICRSARRPGLDAHQHQRRSEYCQRPFISLLQSSHNKSF